MNLFIKELERGKKTILISKDAEKEGYDLLIENVEEKEISINPYCFYDCLDGHIICNVKEVK